MSNKKHFLENREDALSCNLSKTKKIQNILNRCNRGGRQIEYYIRSTHFHRTPDGDGALVEHYQ